MNRNYSSQEQCNSYSWNRTLFPNCLAISNRVAVRNRGFFTHGVAFSYGGTSRARVSRVTPSVTPSSIAGPGCPAPRFPGYIILLGRRGPSRRSCPRACLRPAPDWRRAVGCHPKPEYNRESQAHCASHGRGGTNNRSKNEPREPGAHSWRPEH